MRTIVPQHCFLVLFGIGLLAACASGPQKDIAVQGYRHSIPIMPEVSVLPTIKASDPRRWPVREVQSQVSHCWSIERDGRYNEIGSFRLEARLAPDGSVVESEVVNAEGMLLDPVFRELALSAQQALTDCGALPLPPADYEAWRELTFRFMPSVAAPGPQAADFESLPAESPDFVTISEADALRGQIQRCWNPPIIPTFASTIVELRAYLDPDGSVRRIEKVGGEAFENDPYHRLAVQAATQAVLRCSPLDLPPEKYDDWRVMVLQFDPREVLGE